MCELQHEAQLRKTVFHSCHIEAGGRMVPFAGWELPVQYSGLAEEHQAVRQSCGIFDVSHMGELFVTGKGAAEFVDRLVTGKAAALADGEISYSPMCLETGGIVDDLLVYRMAAEQFLLVVNASNVKKDYDWICKNAPEDVVVADKSAEWAQLAVQGPESVQAITGVFGSKMADLKPFTFLQDVLWHDMGMIISRTGYTGEDGFEIYVCLKNVSDPERHCRELWNQLLESGKTCGMRPAGLGARDTLRFEAKLMLYGNEINENVTPLEARLGWAVDWTKTHFIGKQALEEQKEKGPDRKLVGLTLTGRGVPRRGYALLAEDGNTIGEVTTGTYSPTLKKPLALGYVPAKGYKPGAKLAVEIRGRAVPAEVVKTPFYRRKKQV